MLGVLGGMGPAATVDFLAKIVALTPAQVDQEHLPILVNIAPYIPDRSAAILGHGPSPVPEMIRELHRLTAGGAHVIAIPCNSSHHWHAALQAECAVPILHIATVTIAALDRVSDPVLILATRGTLQSGFYQRQIAGAGHVWCIPSGVQQQVVDRVIAWVKAGSVQEAAAELATLWPHWEGGIGAAILGCTEIPLAAAALPPAPFQLIDSTQALARHCVTHCLGQR